MGTRTGLRRLGLPVAGRADRANLEVVVDDADRDPVEIRQRAVEVGKGHAAGSSHAVPAAPGHGANARATDANDEIARLEAHERLRHAFAGHHASQRAQAAPKLVACHFEVGQGCGFTPEPSPTPVFATIRHERRPSSQHCPTQQGLRPSTDSAFRAVSGLAANKSTHTWRSPPIFLMQVENSAHPASPPALAQYAVWADLQYRTPGGPAARSSAPMPQHHQSTRLASGATRLRHTSTAIRRALGIVCTPLLRPRGRTRRLPRRVRNSVWLRTRAPRRSSPA